MRKLLRAIPRDRRVWATLVAVGLSSRTDALAADLGRPVVGSEAATYTDWSGGYLGVGGSAGGSYGAFDFSRGAIGGRAIPAFRSGDGTGRNDLGQNATTALGGGLAGWNWQHGPWVYGIEGSLDAANLKRPVASTATGFGFEAVDPAFDLVRAKTGLYGMLRARLGFAFERYLVYAAFGLAGAETRYLATYPDLNGGVANTAGRSRGDVGFTLGAGVQYAITDSLALGIDYRYVDLGTGRVLDLGNVPGLGPVSTRASATANQMLLRLMWFPGGLAVPPDPAETAPHDPDNGETGRFSLHGQTTLIAQGVPGFHAPYVGAQSLIPHQARQTTTATVFLGFKLAEGTDLYYNPEFSQGFGLAGTHGVAGFVNGEAQKAGAPFPRLRSNRYYVKQTIGLGGETVEVPDGPNQVATRYDAERITLIAGKFALGDFFDGNVYALDPRVFQRAGLNAEFECRYTLPWLDQGGKLRLGLFSNVGVTANNREIASLTQLGLFDNATDAATATRRPRRKTGSYINLEQALTPELGLFARASLNDGRTEELSYTDIDRSFSGGLSLKGKAWDRPDDTIGFGGVVNGLSPSHRAAFAEGFYGLVIGDGTLRYGREQALETYYAVNLTKFVTLTFDYQFVDHPGYNRDRGPGHFFASRLHADF